MSNEAGDDESCHLFLFVKLTSHWKQLQSLWFFFRQLDFYSYRGSAELRNDAVSDITGFDNW